ncbi:glycosyltransferase [Microbacterium sp. NPDC055683]
MITQPYVPAYRVPLFDAVAKALAAQAIELRVYAGRPVGAQAARGDEATADWMYPIIERSVEVRGRVISFRDLPAHARTADLVISELAVGNLLAWKRLLTRKPTGLWGHGGAFTAAPSRLGDRLKALMARLARFTLTYSAEGRRRLISAGARPHDVSVLGNSTDTLPIRAAVLRERAVRSAPPIRTALFVGGLDASKRIDFLLDVYRAARGIDPQLRLIIVGRGPMLAQIETARSELGGITIVPEARGDELGRIGAQCDMIWMPGRVGLIAVDAIAMGLPVHTVAHEAHAPEIEFLDEAEVAYLPNDPDSFAAASLAGAGQLPLRDDMPTIEGVSARMASRIMDDLTRRG